jgi:DNA mismatch repair protein MutL
VSPAPVVAWGPALRGPQPSAPPPAGFFAGLRVIGQVLGGYIIAERRDALVLIDQHAAHERVMFESLRSALAAGSVPRQRLLVPATVDLGPREAAALRDHVDEMDSLGFEVETFGGSTFVVRAVPALLGDGDPEALLRDVAEELVELGKSRRLVEATESVLARLACHSAVRIGQSLDGLRIRALLDAMDRVDFAGHCPHGRPAYVQLARTELERWFKRT